MFKGGNGVQALDYIKDMLLDPSQENLTKMIHKLAKDN